MKILATILILIAGLGARSQTSFMAYKITGHAFLLKKGNRIAVKMGNVFSENDSIFLDKESSVTLICNNYSSVVFNRQNIYFLKNHTRICRTPPNSFDSIYFNFIWEQLRHTHKTPEENRKEYMGNLGGAIRGCPGIKVEGYMDSVKYCKGNLFLRWQLQQSSDSVSIAFYDDYHSVVPVLSLPVKSDSLKIGNLKQKGLPVGSYYWTFNLDNQNLCTKKYIEIWSSVDFNKLVGSIRKNSGVNLNKAEENYRIGFHLEKSHFYYEAYSFYLAALQLDPRNEFYKSSVQIVKKIYHLN